MSYDYILVIDFEATCHDKDKSWVNEIIEFPIVPGDYITYYSSYKRRECQVSRTNRFAFDLGNGY